MYTYNTRSLTVATGLACALAMAQPEPKAFDVATIKPSAINDNRFMYRGLPGGTLAAVGMPLKMLIMQAYDVKAFQVSGGPSWIATQRWDVEAKVEGVQGTLSRAQHGTMLRALLEDRFQLKVHRETKEMPVYALLIGKNGPKLSLHKGEPPQPGQGLRLGPGSLSFQNGSVAALATQLSTQLWRTVIDKTGLQGEYDFTLKWTPEQGEGGPESIGLPPELPAPPPPESSGPSIFTALQEQLGLRLDSQRRSVEIIVIDSVERPSVN